MFFYHGFLLRLLCFCTKRIQIYEIFRKDNKKVRFITRKKTN